MRDLPAGTVTFLFTDIEGSTRLLHERGDGYAELLAEHRRELRAIFANHHGAEVDTQGDAFFVAFGRADEAVVAAADIQAIEGPIRVRIGIHTGTPTLTDEGYVGMDVHRAARICAAANGGQVVLSEAARSALPGDPVRDLGMHRLKDLGAPERLFQVGTSRFPPLRSLNATNLPTQMDPLVGRIGELVDVAVSLETHHVVTLTGPGGSGKTRLALQAAAESVDAFTGGVFWVPLAAVTDPSVIEGTIAQTIGAHDGAAAFIDERHMLLLLDNLEQLLPDAAEPLATLVAACPNLRLLLTSRAPIRIAGEVEYAVLPLPGNDAVELFRERAFIVEPEAAVHEICRRLDGLPLAIELAAARTRLLPPDKLLERLEHALPVLTGGRRDAPERQRTLRATIAWSYDLLSADARRMFERLGVFAGGFTLEAAEAICDADLEIVETLVEHSLVRHTDLDRLGMLETIREFGVERFKASRDAATIVARHAAYYLALAESANLAVEAEGEERYDIVLPEQANLRAVMEHALATGDITLGMRMAVALEGFWESNDPTEGKRWLRAFLARDDVRPELRVRALRSLGGALYQSGDYEQGTDFHRQALAEYRRLGDEFGISHLLYRLAVEAWRAGDPATSRGLVAESRSHYRGESPWAEAQALNLLGTLALGDGRHAEAVDLLVKSADLADQVGSRWLRAMALLNAAEYALGGGMVETARDLSRTGLDVAHLIGNRQGTVYGLGQAAWISASLGRAEDAGRFWGAIEAEETRSDPGQWARDRETYRSNVFVAAGPDFERGRVEGQSLSLDEAVDIAMGS